MENPLILHFYMYMIMILGTFFKTPRFFGTIKLYVLTKLNQENKPLLV